MQHPFFYIASYKAEKYLALDENTGRHIVQVLRMKKGDIIHLTDGKGHLLTCQIAETGKKNCSVEVKEAVLQKEKTKRISIGISLLKNPSRFEWFLEKATEIGVAEIIPLICERTEKEKFRLERLQNICISAILQSRQYCLPKLNEPKSFHDAVMNANAETKFIAHCEDTNKNELKDLVNEETKDSSSTIILIGPEGDFTNDEINFAIANNFKPVSLGDTRLRTETAGVVAAAWLVS
ncbi:MAG TPA: RsmE family RNA methyltransferase [Chitinophagaceae bacterium]|nr:RsmE family RNA methyltransferase [Chitinophagaceae bacterium]